ncbi:type II secretion system F family protein [Candidatus Omnitrophota bacterium]
MANFKYKARDKFAKAVSGTIVAKDKDDAAKKLKSMDYTPVSISQAKEIGAEKFLRKLKRVKPQDLNAFTRQLYSMQKAGVPLLSSFQAIAGQMNNAYFKLVIEEIARDVRGGLSFSDALKKHPQVFDEIYTNMIAAAERGGAMVGVLERLNGLIEQEIDTQQQIKAATRYPLIAFFVLCAGFLIVVTFVIPRFAALYGQFNAVLPLPTRILIGLNIVISRFWYIFFIALGVSSYAFIHFIHSQFGRPVWDNFKLKLPVLGPLLSMFIMARFTRITAMLIKSGIPILEVFDLVGRTLGNVIIARAVANIRSSVSQGKGISEPMKVTALFPPVVVQMVAIGEQTGKVDELLFSVADYYDRESGYMIKNLTTYIEPVLIFVLGMMVLLMALGIFMPMWNLIKVFNPS